MPHEHPTVRVAPTFAVAELQRALDHHTSLGSGTTHDGTSGFAAAPR